MDQNTRLKNGIVCLRHLAAGAHEVDLLKPINSTLSAKLIPIELPCDVNAIICSPATRAQQTLKEAAKEHQQLQVTPQVIAPELYAPILVMGELWAVHGENARAYIDDPKFSLGKQIIADTAKYLCDVEDASQEEPLLVIGHGVLLPLLGYELTGIEDLLDIKLENGCGFWVNALDDVVYF